MPSPREVFDHPENYIDLITTNNDDKFESQYFDRKECGNIENGKITKSSYDKLKEHILQTISAFTNSNKEGGLLIIGISKHGILKGISHLGENELNSITSFSTNLRNQTSITKIFEIKIKEEVSKILLIYSPYGDIGICETLKDFPQSWFRNGAQNMALSEQMKEQFKRDKGFIKYENTICCSYSIEDVDKDVLKEFRKSRLENSEIIQSDEEFLYNIGALIRKDSNYSFNNAGYLFFAKNPQMNIPYAYIRLLRFDTESKNYKNRGINNFDKKFDGALPQQIRKIRTFFNESGFFKTFVFRKASGGFLEEEEFPPIAVDEAIVNAVAHRDYGVELPIECILYSDAFIVENAGKILQRDRDIPKEFSLDDIVLNSMPRNSKIVEWLKLMKDDKGTAFVRMISEGTKRMKEEMLKLGLPAPLYIIKSSSTIVILYNNYLEREAKTKAESISKTSDEHTNLYRVDFLKSDDIKGSFDEMENKKKEILQLLSDVLISKGWFIDQFRYGKIVFHRQGKNINLPNKEIGFYVQFFPAYSLQLRQYIGKFFISVDYTLEIKNIKNVYDLLKIFSLQELNGLRGIVNFRGWRKCKILETSLEFCLVYIFDLNVEETVENNTVIPDLPISYIRSIINKSKINFNLDSEIKKYSLSNETNASRIRDEKTHSIVEILARDVFPLSIGNQKFFLNTLPLGLKRVSDDNSLSFETLAEPVVEFHHHMESSNIREGIVKFGSYEFDSKTIEIVPICLDGMRDNMIALIQRLKLGKFKYLGSERTFSCKFNYNPIITLPSADSILIECERLLNEHNNWVANRELNRIFLIQIPEKEYSLNDEQSPYYQVKSFLFEKGIPCQIIDTPTLINPDWKDLNLALNVVAKCGVTPWVLPDKIPDADFFIGLSYTQSNIKSLRRLLGYATVFNEFGRWEFYTGNTNTFSYEERNKYFSLLTKQTLEKLNLSQSPNIYFHYSAKFSKEDKDSILKEARTIRPDGNYNFVSINIHHNIRLYDDRAFTDGSLSRGSYIITAPNQILISTTGYNLFRKNLGTPKPLEVTIWSYKPEGIINSEPDLKSLAKQILSLTKLNWASTDSICGEPITTKYAGDIAYLTDAFLRLRDTFNLNPVLEKTPWFI